VDFDLFIRCNVCSSDFRIDNYLKTLILDTNFTHKKSEIHSN